MPRLLDSSALVDQMMNHERTTSFYRDCSILDLTVYEAANAFWKLWRARQLISFEDASAHIANLSRLRGVMRLIGVASLDIEAVHELAKGTGLTIYDSSYVAVAQREGLELVTADEKMRKAAASKVTTIASADMDPDPTGSSQRSTSP